MADFEPFAPEVRDGWVRGDVGWVSSRQLAQVGVELGRMPRGDDGFLPFDVVGWSATGQRFSLGTIRARGITNAGTALDAWMRQVLPSVAQIV